MDDLDDDLSRPTAPAPRRNPLLKLGLVGIGVTVAALVGFLVAMLVTAAQRQQQMLARQQQLIARQAVAGAQMRAAQAAALPRPAPKGEEAIKDPDLRQARDRLDAILADLRAGKLDADPGLSPLARKLKGYRLAYVVSQRKTGDGQAEFKG